MKKAKRNRFLIWMACAGLQAGLVHSQETNSQDDLINLETNTLFEKLFDKPEIVHNIAIWQPNYYERQNFNLSYDEKCHTALDTLLYFKDKKDRNCCLAIFKTMSYIQENGVLKVAGCHFCNATVSAALFRQKENMSWETYGFQKYFLNSGLFGGSGKGGVGKMAIRKIQDESFLLFQKPIEGNQDHVSGKEILVSLEFFSELGAAPLAFLFFNEYHAEKSGKVFKNEILFKDSTQERLTVQSSVSGQKNTFRKFRYSEVSGMFE